MNDQTHCLVKVLILTLCIPPVVQHDCCYYKYIIGVKYNFRPKKLISHQIGWNLNLRSIFMRGITLIWLLFILWFQIYGPKLTNGTFFFLFPWSKLVYLCQMSWTTIYMPRWNFIIIPLMALYSLARSCGNHVLWNILIFFMIFPRANWRLTCLG
jgi:hypothetical protein